MNYFKKLFIHTIIGVSLFSGCGSSGSGDFGLEIPDDVAMVNIQEVLDAPDKYSGQRVKLTGNISTCCPSGCNFTLQDGAFKTIIFPQGYKLDPKSAGKRATVYAEITSGEENVVLTAMGISITEGAK